MYSCVERKQNLYCPERIPNYARVRNKTECNLTTNFGKTTRKLRRISICNPINQYVIVHLPPSHQVFTVFVDNIRRYTLSCIGPPP